MVDIASGEYQVVARVGSTYEIVRLLPKARNGKSSLWCGGWRICLERNNVSLPYEVKFLPRCQDVSHRIVYVLKYVVGKRNRTQGVPKVALP